MIALHKQQLTFESTQQFSSLFLDYVNNKAAIRELYAFRPDKNGLELAISQAEKQKYDRASLVTTLSRQHKDAHTESQKSVGKLSDNNTFTVVTGHQLCLFTGPLYFLYKIITTINLCRELNKLHADKYFVPVYWMASEDHDFEEINHFHLFGKKIQWDNNQSLKDAAGGLSTAGIASLSAAFQKMLGESLHAATLVELFNRAYLEHHTLSEATRYLVNQLFGQYGLVIIDPADAGLKKAFLKEMQHELQDDSNSKHVLASIQQLEKNGYAAQVNPRPINLFYLAPGQRERIEWNPATQQYTVLNTSITFSKEEIIHELNQYPERFSPNVVLRPLYQQLLLPNIAYVGGPGELAYWLEYKKMFESRHILFPVLFPRNHVMWIDKTWNERIRKIGLETADFFKDTDVLLREYTLQNAGDAINISAEEEALRKTFLQLKEKAIKADAGLAQLLDGELQKNLNSLKNIEGKMLRAEKQKQESSLNQIKKIKEKLFPGGSLQERYENFSAYFLLYGPCFIDTLIQELSPFNQVMYLLEEEHE
jgi:bacillithiol synthase